MRDSNSLDARLRKPLVKEELPGRQANYTRPQQGEDKINWWR